MFVESKSEKEHCSVCRFVGSGLLQQGCFNESFLRFIVLQQGSRSKESKIPNRSLRMMNPIVEATDLICPICALLRRESYAIDDYV